MTAFEELAIVRSTNEWWRKTMKLEGVDVSEMRKDKSGIPYFTIRNTRAEKAEKASKRRNIQDESI